VKIEFGGFKREGWITVNIEKADVKHNLNEFPYPFADNSTNEVLMLHTLEHLTEPKKVMAEIYRICKPNAKVTIEVPYWKKDMWTNPEHKHYFRPDWFMSLRPDSRKYRNMESWCPYNYRTERVMWIRGKHAKWRKYGLRVELRVKKES